jgi:hypothetical protein
MTEDRVAAMLWSTAVDHMAVLNAELYPAVAPAGSALATSVEAGHRIEPPILTSLRSNV